MESLSNIKSLRWLIRKHNVVDVGEAKLRSATVLVSRSKIELAEVVEKYLPDIILCCHRQLPGRSS
jgi:hypothetical protein